LTTTSYVPGYDATSSDAGGWFQALWIAVIRKRDLSLPTARRTRTILDELTRLGMLKRIEFSDRFRYHLTTRGSDYFYDQNELGNNSERWPYMCFSRVIPERIAWERPSSADAGHLRVAFTWKPVPVGAWMTPRLKPYGVVLTPTMSPTVATLVRRREQWVVASMDVSYPSVANRAAWLPPH
jgi:hypothetical protein